MKVILLKDTANLGKRGEIKEVANVYGINVLIKRGSAVEATTAEIAKWKQKEELQKRKKETANHTFLELISKLRNNKVSLSGRKYDQKGQLFASIKESDIADEIYKVSGISIDPKQIIISKHIKSLGLHEVELKQGVQKERIVVEVK